MSEDLIAKIMQAEQMTAKINSEVQAEADKIIATAKKEADAIRATALAEAQKQAQEIIGRGSIRAEDERNRILAAVRQEIIALETKADANTDDAVAYVVQQLLGFI